MVMIESREPIRKLRHGDRLTRAEFERRYEAMPHLKKAELIEGVVCLPSDTGTLAHAASRMDLITWLGLYHAGTPGTQGADNATVRLDAENEPQPDALLRILPEYGGQTRTEEGYVVGAPEWLGEVSASSASYDLHDKMNAYRRNGVREYVVWRVWDEAIDWFALREGRFERLPLTEAGLYRSEVLPGLWLDPAALVRGDMPRVLRVAQDGLSSPEHAAFVQRLQQGRNPRSGA